jgi:DNA-binding protein HU-alpha
VHKKYAKPVVEAMMDALGAAIAEGRTVNLQPMGKIKPQRVKDGPGARVVIAKIRQNKAAAPASGPDEAKEAVADDEKER